MHKITVVLLRVSTDRQKTDSQKKLLEQECSRRGLVSMTLEKYQEIKQHVNHDNLAVWVEDYATGANTNRDGYQWALGQVEGGWVAAVLAYDTSRIGRSLRNNLAFADACIRRNTSLIGVSDHVDLTTPDGRLKYNILSAMAEYQREQISEKVKAGIAARKAKGLRHGGTAKGWSMPHIRRDLKQFHEMVDAGRSNYAIRRVLGWNYRTCRKYRLLRDQPALTHKQVNEIVYGKSNSKM